ncbi:MAG: hypothetical protein ACLUKK_04385 [Lacrimispora saccharolytica]|nr:hypothetical protein [Clostridium sp.]
MKKQEKKGKFPLISGIILIWRQRKNKNDKGYSRYAVQDRENYAGNEKNSLLQR